MLFLWIPKVWLVQGKAVMEANYFWHSWLSVCFHGKPHSPGHWHNLTVRNCLSLDYSLVKWYFQISLKDLYLDNKVLNVNLCWLSKDDLKFFTLTKARTVNHKTKYQHILIVSAFKSALCSKLNSKSAFYFKSFHSVINCVKAFSKFDSNRFRIKWERC